MKQFIFLLGLLFAIPSHAQDSNLSYYLPAEISYNPDIPTPKSVIGHDVGEWHISHDRLVDYMQALANASDRMKLVPIGHTFESRPLYLMVVSTPKNLKNLDEIKKQHRKLTDPSQSSELNVDKMPGVVWMGYSVHGNEPSGSNASMLTAYYLAAAEGKEIEEMLANNVILIDPSINPDGLNRFANWVNTQKGKTETSDPNNLELNEPWPGGRTNHYWFDMNRDWLPAQLPESQARVRAIS